MRHSELDVVVTELREATGRVEALSLIREARSPSDLERRLVEFNQCHSPATGKFCSGMSSSGQAAMKAARTAKAGGGDWRRAASGAYLAADRAQSPIRAQGVASGRPAARYASKIERGRYKVSPWERVTGAITRRSSKTGRQVSGTFGAGKPGHDPQLAGGVATHRAEVGSRARDMIRRRRRFSG